MNPAFCRMNDRPSVFAPLSFSSTDCLNQIIEALQEAGAVSFVVGRQPPCHVPRVPQKSHNVSVRKGFSDGLFRKDTSIGVQDPGSLFDTPRRKRHISRHHYIIPANVFYNPIVSGVHMVIHHYPFNQLVIRNPHSGIGVGDKIDLKPITLCYPDCFILNGAGIGIYIYVDQ